MLRELNCVMNSVECEALSAVYGLNRLGQVASVEIANAFERLQCTLDVGLLKAGEFVIIG